MENREELQIRVKEGPKAETLVSKIRSTMTDATVKCKGRNNKDVLFQIRDLEQDVSEEDLKRSSPIAIGETEESALVREMRPANGRTQNARVSLPEELGKKLSKMPRVK